MDIIRKNMNNSVLNITVSCFESYDAVTSPKPVNLMTWLNSAKYKNKIDYIRQLATKDDRDTEKKKLPCVTISGTFTKRATESLVNHSGLLCIDIDFKENKHITNYNNLKTELSKIKNFAYIGLSASGTGYYCIIPISQPDKHKLHFEAIKNDLLRFGICIDKSCSDVSRLRFYSYDNEAYFNHSAITYTKLYKEPPAPPPPVRYNNSGTTSTSTPPEIISKMIRTAIDGEKHHVLLKASRLAGGYIAGNQISEAEAVHVLETEIKNRKINSFSQAQKTIRDGIKSGKQIPIYKNESIKNINKIKVSNSNYSNSDIKNNTSFDTPAPVASYNINSIAGEVLEPQNNYTHDTLVQLIALATDTTGTTANEIINRMMDSGIITLAKNVNRYYLSNSTPF